MKKTKTIEHNGKTYSLDEVKSDLEVIANAINNHWSNVRYDFTAMNVKPPFGNFKVEEIKSSLRYLRFLCCGIERQPQDKDMPAFQANDVFKKYVNIDKSKKPVYSSSEYSRYSNRPYELDSKAYRLNLAKYKDKLLLQMEDLVLAAKNPTLCKIYAVIPGSKKEQHIQIVQESQNSEPQQ